MAVGQWKRLWLASMLCLAGPLAASAHIGNPTTIYEGFAGSVPVRVSVRVPSVVPGLAEISVRVFTNGVTRVTVLPVLGRAGLKGAPPPDVCNPVTGEANLFHAQLWLMARGAYSVSVAVDSASVNDLVPGSVTLSLSHPAARATPAQHSRE